MCKGNIKEQRKRRKKVLKERKDMKPTKEKVCLIDGNYTHYPVAYCKIHGAYLTHGLLNIHRCEKRKCKGLREEVVQ